MEKIESLIKIFTLSLGNGVEILAALVIGHAVLKGAFNYARNIFFARSRFEKMEIRLSLGKSLAVALEFLLAADILRTAVAPSWDEIGKLAAIAALRTLLNYFLERELKQAERLEQVKEKNDYYSSVKTLAS